MTDKGKKSFARKIIDEGVDVWGRRGIGAGNLRKALCVVSSPYLAGRIAIRENKEASYQKDLKSGKIREVLDYTEMFITSYCSIDCKWCSASIPYYKNKYHIPLERIQAQLTRYLGAIDAVEKFRILGGEPFLHPDLPAILQQLMDTPKVHSIRIVTNGTVVPKNPKLLDLLRNPKIVLDISNYGPVSDKVPELQELEREGKIHLNIDTVTTWFVPNHDYTDKGLTDEQAYRRYCNCKDYCHVLRDGKFFYCGEAFHIANIPDTPMVAGVDFVDLMDESKSLDELGAEIKNLVFKRADRMNACTRCVGSFLAKDRFLVAGEQLKPGEAMPFELPADIENVSTKMI